jgi:hypothetical protein
LPRTIERVLLGSYGQGPEGLSPRELKLVRAGAQIAVLALYGFVEATEPTDKPPDTPPGV